MIVQELVARFGISVEGLEKVRRAIALMGKLQKAIAAVAALVLKRMGRVTSIFAKTALAATAFGGAFVSSAAVITAAAGTINVALAGVAAGFAKLRQQTIDGAFLSGVPVKQLAFVETLMKRIGASAEDGRKFVGDFVDKLREGAKEGGDWADMMAKQGVKIKGPKGKARPWSNVLDDILAAADKMKDLDARRDFLKEGLAGAPDKFIAQLLQSSSALNRYRELVEETRKGGGVMRDGDILNSQDITNALGKFQTVIAGFTDSIGSGLMASFAKDFRELGNTILEFATDERREKVRAFAATIAEFTKDVYGGGKTVLGGVVDAIKEILGALSGINEATGGVLGQVARGLFMLGAALAVVAAGPATTIAAGITSLLWAVAKFQEWKDGGTNALSDFFDTISSAADRAREAISKFLEAIRSGGLGRFISPQAPEGGNKADTPAGKRRDTIEDGIERQEKLRRDRLGSSDRPGFTNGYRLSENVEDRRPDTSPGFLDRLGKMLQGLSATSLEMAPAVQTQKIKGDQAGSRNVEINAPVSAPVSVAATFNGVITPEASAHIKKMIDSAIDESASRIAARMSLRTNAATLGIVNGSSAP